jgi:hypothetical protein
MMFAGFGVTLRDLPGYLKWGSYISYLRYGLEGYVGALFFRREQLDCEAMYCHYKYANFHSYLGFEFISISNSPSIRYPDKFLKEIAMDADRFSYDIWALLFTMLLLRVVCYFILKWQIVLKR